MNTFGTKFRLSTFGESHGVAIGGVIDGIPAGIKVDMSFIQSELDRRRPGGKYATSRKESDKILLFMCSFIDAVKSQVCKDRERYLSYCSQYVVSIYHTRKTIVVNKK